MVKLTPTRTKLDIKPIPEVKKDANWIKRIGGGLLGALAVGKLIHTGANAYQAYKDNAPAVQRFQEKTATHYDPVTRSQVPGRGPGSDNPLKQWESK
jgi:hypothetical protein